MSLSSSVEGLNKKASFLPLLSHSALLTVGCQPGWSYLFQLFATPVVENESCVSEFAYLSTQGREASENSHDQLLRLLLLRHVQDGESLDRAQLVQLLHLPHHHRPRQRH